MNLISEIWHTYRSFAPYLLLGLVFNGFLFLFVKRDFIRKNFGGNKLWDIVKAALIGVPMPLCSCGVIPTALYLRKSGASKGAVLSFLISTPQTGVDSIVPTWGILGPVFGLFRPVVAFIMGIVGGWAGSLVPVDDSGQESSGGMTGSENCAVCDRPMTAHPTFWSRVRCAGLFSFRDFLDDITLHLLVGIVLAGLIAWLIPADFFAGYGGRGWPGMLLLLALGIPLYVCATSSIPIAATLIMKGFSPGAAFVFLVVGPATNIATIGLVSKSLGKKTTLVYLGVMIVLSLGFGWLLNGILWDFTPDRVSVSGLGESSLFHEISIWIFTLLVVMSLYRISVYYLRRIIERMREVGVEANETLYKVEGMTCMHCVKSLENALRATPGILDVEISLATKSVKIRGSVSADTIKRVVEDTGFEMGED